MVDVGIFVGTVYGNAQHVAEQAQQMIESKGYSAAVYDEPTLEQFDKTKTVVFISSTTGQGDLPPNIEFFLMDLRDTCPMMNQKPFADCYTGAHMNARHHGNKAKCSRTWLLHCYLGYFSGHISVSLCPAAKAIPHCFAEFDLGRSERGQCGGGSNKRRKQSPA